MPDYLALMISQDVVILRVYNERLIGARFARPDEASLFAWEAVKG